MTVRASAQISECELHRLTLTRQWGSGERVLFIMLNPSTADALKPDPTVTRCLGFAARWGFGSFEVVNLFTWRSTDPRLLLGTPKRFLNVSDADEQITAAIGRADAVVLAWGSMSARRWARERVEEVVQLARATGKPLFRLGELCKDGNPRHPLYLASNTELNPW